MLWSLALAIVLCSCLWWYRYSFSLHLKSQAYYHQTVCVCYCDKSHTESSVRHTNKKHVALYLDMIEFWCCVFGIFYGTGQISLLVCTRWVECARNDHFHTHEKRHKQNKCWKYLNKLCTSWCLCAFSVANCLSISNWSRKFRNVETQSQSSISSSVAILSALVKQR